MPKEEVKVTNHDWCFKLMFDETLKSLKAGHLSNAEKVHILWAVKECCIKFKVRQPEWWYEQRNLTSWMLEDGTLIFDGLHLGGF